MILDAEGREDSWFDRVFDVCVVGAGPAGITLSRQLARHGREVCLLEGGGKEASQESQELYQGDVIGFNYLPLDVTRLRFFGGTSNHWRGLCRPLDAWDFAPRAGNPYSGWPITKDDLDPYADETDAILDFNRASDSSGYFVSNTAPFLPVDFHQSAPTRFGKKYAKELDASGRIRVCLNANLVGIQLDSARRQVTALTCKSYQKDAEFSVQARKFVLCLGGIENPRTLLNTQGEDRYAIGNRYDLVGRSFCEHLHYALGHILFQKAPPDRVFLGPTPEMMDRFGILNFGLRMRPPRVAESTLREIVCSTSLTQKIAESIGAPYNCNPLGRFAIASEQALNPDSRVKLTNKVDRFGLRRAALDWRLSEVDYRTIRTAAMECGHLFAERKLGRIRLNDWVLDPAASLPPLGKAETLGNHHMCTTRMSAHPRHGVVDADCRVHEVDNLYLGGSSVFATGGQSNPTYTIVQLALRLGDHLHRQLG